VVFTFPGLVRIFDKEKSAMKTKAFLFITIITFLILAIPGCSWFFKKPKRETIFDKVVTIPKELVLDVPYLPPFCDEIKDLKKGYVDVKDGKLYYEEEGQGIPMVLINGGPGGTHHVFHPYFSRIADVARVIYYDQRGTGKSSQDDAGKTYTIEQAVEDLEELRKALNIEKWVVLGWSYGGLLAQCYALAYSSRCTGLILGASDPQGGDPTLYTGEGPKYERAAMFISQEEFDAWNKIKEETQKGTLTPAQSFYNRYLTGFWKFAFYHKPTKESVIKNAHYGCTDPAFRKTMISEIAKINLKGKFDDFKIPTLVVEGKWDVLWGDMDRVSIMRKTCPHAQIAVFEKSGHTIFADEPDKFFALLREFLKELKK